VICLRPRVPGEIMGPRCLSGVVVRPLNFTVRRLRNGHAQGSRGQAPQAPGDSMRPRLWSGASARPLNFTVRRRLRRRGLT
jgi:hypothetical protein